MDKAKQEYVMKACDDEMTKLIAIGLAATKIGDNESDGQADEFKLLGEYFDKCAKVVSSQPSVGSLSGVQPAVLQVVATEETGAGSIADGWFERFILIGTMPREKLKLQEIANAMGIPYVRHDHQRRRRLTHRRRRRRTTTITTYRHHQHITSRRRHHRHQHADATGNDKESSETTSTTFSPIKTHGSNGLRGNSEKVGPSTPDVQTRSSQQRSDVSINSPPHSSSSPMSAGPPSELVTVTKCHGDPKSPLLVNNTFNRNFHSCVGSHLINM